MTGQNTSRMLDAYIEARVSPRLFLSSFFKTTSKSFHSAKTVQFDVARGEPHVAVPIPGEHGFRKIEKTKSTNKELIPPRYALEAPIEAWSTGERQAGQNPFDDPNFRENARNQAFNIGEEAENMIRRGIELQASQIFQTGKLLIKDSTNTTVFDLDFLPKATHFPTVTTDWHAAGSAGDPEADLDALATVIRRDGKQNPTDLVFGATARTRFMKNANILAKFDNIGLQRLQEMLPGDLGLAQNATLFGRITLGAYSYRCWFYDDFYVDPYTGTATRYVGDDKVIMIAEAGRRDKTFGALPSFVPPDGRVVQFLPPRLSSQQGDFDLSTNIWVTPDGSTLTMSAGTRALLVPVAMDTFGCLDMIQ